MTIRPEADGLVKYLNELLAIDQDFVSRLVDHRVTCNEQLARHPSVQVGKSEGDYRAGFLGVLNGYLGVIDRGPRRGWGPITAVLEDGKVVRFQRTPE